MAPICSSWICFYPSAMVYWNKAEKGSFALKTLLWNFVRLLRVTLEFHPPGKVIAHIHTQVYTNSILAVMIDVMLPPSISIVNWILTISLLVCLTVFLSSLLFKAFNASIFLLRLFFPLLPLPGCLSYEFTSPFFFITLIIPFDHPRLYSTALPPSIIALCFAHSWGIWMTVSCEAFCLCWPASASSSFSSRLSFFLSVSLSRPPLCNLYHPPLFIILSSHLLFSPIQSMVFP